MSEQLMILVAGPYRSGTNDDPVLIQRNVDAMEDTALAVFRRGHLPVLGEWFALPLLKHAGSTKIGDAVFDEIFHLIARELIPVMQAQGKEDEETALSLGATGWQTFWRVTLPNIRWGLLYGVLLCNARAMGEFGAVSVVSGHIRGLTNTMPLHVEILYNEYNYTAAFAVASLLALLALLTLAGKSFMEWRQPELRRATHLPRDRTRDRTRRVNT